MGRKKGNPTVQDIAKELSISASTVSRALNDHPKISIETKARVKEMALNLGYAQNISSALRHDLIGKTIGIILPSLSQSKYALMLEASRLVFEENGYKVIVCYSSDSKEKEKDNLRLLENIGVDGVLVSLSSEGKNIDYFNKYAKTKPLAFFDRISFDVDCSKVMIDHFQAGFRAVQHLLKIGCRNIAHIGGNYNCLLTRQISTGYKTAMRNSGFQVNPKFELFSDYLYDDVMGAVELLFNNKKKPDSIIIDDIMAAQKLVSILITHGIKIPDDISIIAIGDEKDYSFYSPSITTIQLPYGKMGALAAKLLINNINSEKDTTESEVVVVPFDMNIRNSTLRK